MGRIHWSFPYIIKHKNEKDNVIVDALSRRYTMLSQLDFKIFGLQTVKDQYVNDADFKDAFAHCLHGKPWGKFHIQDVFLFRANKLCIPASSVCLLLLQEAHGGGLMGHFGVYKTHGVLAAHFFWPRMRADVERLVARCTTCQKAKSRLNNHDLKPYLGEDEELPSRMTSVQEGEDNEDTTSTSTSATLSPSPAPPAPSSAPPSGPITWDRAREFNFVMMLKNEGPKD
jgi:hypothetical protein